MYKAADWLILKSGDIGYRVEMDSAGMMIGKEIEIYVHQYVREDKINLYGFSDVAQLEMFEALIDISGVGPKVAMSIIATIPIDQFTNAVQMEDAAVISEVKGIGKKTSQRIILEMQNKIGELGARLGAASVSSDGAPVDNTALGEARDALVSLGYSGGEINETLTELQKQDDFEELETDEIVKRALTQMAS